MLTLGIARASGAEDLPDRLERDLAALAAPLAIDPSLSRGARDHGLELLEGSAAELTSLKRVLTRQGVMDAQILPFSAIGPNPEDLEGELRRFVRGRVLDRGFTNFGLAWVGSPSGRNVLVAVFVRRLLDLGPIPRSTSAPELGLRGRLLLDLPLSALMTVPGGEVVEVEVQRNGRSVSIPLSFEHGKGRYTFEALVDGPRGPEVAALWSIGFGAPPPDEPAPLGAGIDGRAQLRERLDRERRALGRAPLAESVALTKAADAHARAVCERLLAVHVLPRGEGPEARAARAGYRGRVAENVAIAGTVAEAHRNLMESPSHRRNVLRKEAKDVGLGVVRRSPVTNGVMGPSDLTAPAIGAAPWCVVELFGAH
ncbi:MAG: CAP domain-containing protein [Deltaproteobacteria bacterium]|nr:CAP domain-containing protein [Deltaproteobacteria bacterium]